MKISQYSIGSIGIVPIKLPVLTIGKQPPIVSIVTGLHGGEESGLLILRDLIRALRRRPFQGTLRLLPSGNPLTQAFKSRFSPIDFVNPNRAFPGKANGDLSQRIAFETLRLLRGSAAVIDLHCFSQDCVVTGILVSSGSSAVVEQNRRLLGLLSADCVWVERLATPDGQSIRNNLGGYLNSIGVPNVGIEMPRADHLSPAARQQVVQGILRMLRALERGILPPARLKLELRRRDVRADVSAMFIPLKSPLAKLSRGTLVGRLIDPLTFRETAIVSPMAGRMLLIARAGLVRTGDKLFAVGQSVRYTTP